MFSKINQAEFGVPKYVSNEIKPKQTKYCLCIPIINEGDRIHKQLQRAQINNIHQLIDIIICDGGSIDGSTTIETLDKLGVNTLLTKEDVGKQGAQFRMGISFALNRGYEGIITVDGNNKDSIESVPLFIKKLDEGFDFIQGSRYVPGGKAVNTPKIRHFAVKFIHSPLISITANHQFTDSTNAFRAHSKKYLTHPKVLPLRPIFVGYELLAYLSVRASQLKLKVTEVPVERTYPASGKTPTKISFFKGNFNLIKILFFNLFRKYNP